MLRKMTQLLADIRVKVRPARPDALAPMAYGTVLAERMVSGLRNDHHWSGLRAYSDLQAGLQLCPPLLSTTPCVLLSHTPKSDVRQPPKEEERQEGTPDAVCLRGNCLEALLVR